MCVAKMASLKQLTQTLELVRWFTFLLVVGTSVNGQSIKLTKEPADRLTMVGDSVAFTCTVTRTGLPSDTQIMWYRGDNQINQNGIFEMTKNNNTLIIKNVTAAYNGVYSCKFGNQSSEGSLEAVPPSWFPRCERTPSSGSIAVGDTYNITCSSTGHANTSLRWLVPNDSGINSTLENIQLKRVGSTVSITYMDKIANSESSPLFVCEATLDALSDSCSISINDGRSSSAIPFIVVGLMSLIALLLFFVVLFILFRHRQCRFCREPMLEPNTVLDANSLQTGAGIPPPVVAIDMDVLSEDGGSVKDAPRAYDNLEPLSQPPDVVPSQEPVSDVLRYSGQLNKEPVSNALRDSDQLNEEPPVSSETVPEVAVAPNTETAAEPKSKKKNLTINKNMDQKFEKPTQTLEKKAVPPPPRKTRPTQRGQKKKVKHYKEPPVKARIKNPKDPIYAEVKKLNVPSQSVLKDPTNTPSTSSGVETSPREAPTPPPRPSSSPGDEDSKETSSIATCETDSTDKPALLVNDLGRGDSKKKRVRHYRKKSEDINRNSNKEAELNIQSSKEDPSMEPSGSSEKKNDKAPADRVIYAELDFSQKVGLNILE